MKNTKTEQMKTEAARMIVEAVQFAVSAAVNAADCGVELAMSLYLNIRDAMFHYKALCDSLLKGNEDNAMKNYVSLKEHLLRGKKDAVLAHTYIVCKAIGRIMEQKNFNNIFCAEEARRLRSCNNNLKGLVLNVRLAGREPGDEQFSIERTWEKVTACTIEAVTLCRNRNISLF